MDDYLSKLVMESQHEFYFIVGAGGERTVLTPEYYRVTGFSAEEIQSTSYQSRIHSEDLGLVEQARQENLRGIATRVTYRSLCKNGSVLWMELRAQPILDDQGRLQRIICCARPSSAPRDRQSVSDKSGAMPIKVLVIDDHSVLRTALRMLFSAQSDMTVVGDAGDVGSGLELIRRTKPDVVTLDLTMAGGGGLSVLDTLRTENASVRVLVLTMHDEPAYLKAVLGAGGAGYVTKSADESEVLAAIRAVAQGRTYYSLSMNDALIRTLSGQDAQPSSSGDETLSRRERAVLALVAQGYTNQQVADKLALSVKTIETYRARIMSKLGFKDRAQLVTYALQSGLLEKSGIDEAK